MKVDETDCIRKRWTWCVPALKPSVFDVTADDAPALITDVFGVKVAAGTTGEEVRLSAMTRFNPQYAN